MLLCIYKYFYVCLNKLYTPDIMSKPDTICIPLDTIYIAISLHNLENLEKPI